MDSRERLALMDGLRGLALFGIFLVNIAAMGAPSMAYGLDVIWTDGFSLAVSGLRHFAADGAFIFLFAVLFGAGFSVMMGPFGRRAAGIGLPAYYRRLFLIGCFGLLPVAALWFGDVHMIYAFFTMPMALAYQVLLVGGLFALQMLVSLLWLRLFRMGPLEWLLRRFTYFYG